MYAIIEDGGKQYRVQKGDKLFVELKNLPGSEDTVEFDKVIMLGDGKSSRIGTPWVSGAKVTAKLHGRIRGPKLEIVKFRRRKGYRLHKGHRQDYLQVTIDEIKG